MKKLFIILIFCMIPFVSADKILFIGDSLTVGVGATNNSGYVSILESWYNHSFINAGCSGSTSLDWTREGNITCFLGGAWEMLAEEHLPVDMVHISLGGNDAVGYWEQEPVSVENYTNAIYELINRIGNETKIILSTTILNPSMNPNVTERIFAYKDVVTNISYGNMSDNIYFGGNFTNLSIDYITEGVHPNDEGHFRLARMLEESLISQGLLHNHCNFSDIDRNGVVGMNDYTLLMNHWNETCSFPYYCNDTDIDKNGGVGVSDYSILIDNWSCYC